MNNRETEVLSKEHVNKLNKLSGLVLDAAIEVHKNPGPSLQESVYESCLFKKLLNRNINSLRQAEIPILYKGEVIDKEFYIDLFAENEVKIDLKNVEKILPIHKTQIMTYLKLTIKNRDCLLILMSLYQKHGFERILNGNFPKN